MKARVSLLAGLLALSPLPVAAETGDASARYPNYYAARQALAQGDCARTLEHLRAFLANHPEIPERYPDFHIDLLIVMGQCDGTVRVRGIEEESSGIDPLPAFPPAGE